MGYCLGIPGWLMFICPHFHVLGQFLLHSWIKGETLQTHMNQPEGALFIKDKDHKKIGFLIKLKSFGYGVSRALNCSVEQMEVIE